MCKNFENVTEVVATGNERQDINRQDIKTNTNNTIQNKINNNQEGDNTKKNINARRKIKKRTLRESTNGRYPSFSARWNKRVSVRHGNW